MPNVMATLPNRGGALCSTPQFGWRPLLDCRAVMLPRHETRWHLQGCPKLANRSQPQVGRSSPYCRDIWERYCCLTSFFLLSICALVAKIQPDKCAMVPKWRFFVSRISSEPRAAHFRHAFEICTKATPCAEVWQTSNLRPLRLGEEKKIEEEEERNHRAKI